MSTKSIFATGVDAGSTHTRCVISLLENQRLRLIGYGSTPSHGWAKSRISEQQAVSDCVFAGVEEAEGKAQRRGETREGGRGEQPRTHGVRPAPRSRTAGHQPRHGSRHAHSAAGGPDGAATAPAG